MGLVGWNNDKVQFARLLVELITLWDAEDAKRIIEAVAKSMDLEVEEVLELFDRADNVWQKAIDALPKESGD